MSDGKIDGKFTIKSGQGISQAIRDELGLTQTQCNKLGFSVWKSIFEQVKKQNDESGNLYTGGSDLSGAYNKNFVVKPNQVIEFSKDIWKEMVKIVNEKLGTDIKIAEDDIVPNPPQVDSNPPSKTDSNPPKADSNPPKPVTANLPRKDNNPPRKDNNPPVKVQPLDTDAGNVYDSNGNLVREV